jgi:lipid-binding SYLF domain-containing protein
MSKRILTPVLFLLMVAFVSPVLAASPAEERAEIDKAAAKVLNDLYKEQPSAKKAVNAAVGYAVFSNFGMKIFFAGGGSGKGYAVGGGKKTYMKMLEVQAGLGLGVKKFGLVWVFNSKSAYDQFVNSGWEVGPSTRTRVMRSRARSPSPMAYSSTRSPSRASPPS